MAEADAEHRHLAEQPADGVGGVGDRGGVAGTVGEEHAVGLAGEHVGGAASTPGTTSTVAAGADEVAQDRALDAEVVGDHAERRVVVADGVRLGRW